MSAAALAIAGASAAGAAGLGGWWLAEDRRTRRRLATRIAAVRPPAPAVQRGERKLWTLTGFVAPVLDPLLGLDRSHAADAAVSPWPWLILGGAVGTAAFLLLTALFGLNSLLAGGVGLGAAWMAARMGAATRRGSVLDRMEDDFALALGVIIRCVRAGLPVTEGLRAVAGEVGAPTGPEFRRAVDEIALGEDFDTALSGLADRCALSDYRFFVTAVSLQRQTGGNLAETLDNLADTVRRRKAVKLKARALTSEARATVAVLAILPFAVGVLLLFVNPEYILQLVTTADGKAVLGFAIGIQIAGLLVIRAIVRKSLG